MGSSRSGKFDAYRAMRASLANALVALADEQTGAHELYVSESPHEQRRLLNVLNCALLDGTVECSRRNPFDLLADL